MPKDNKIKKILIIGAGPIIVGQGCEFDYSGTQACLALKEEGCRVILVNPNPATIMTDPDIADVTYLEPITWQILEKIIAKERPDSLLPTMGGQTALNCAIDLEQHGILAKYNVNLIGMSIAAINKAEDRQIFKELIAKINLETPTSFTVNNQSEAESMLAKLSFPIIIRASFCLGGQGGGIAYNATDFRKLCAENFTFSDKGLLIEESIIGWKEYELEVIRDQADNCIVVCSIENLNPMGVHTGDSITIAPIQTLTDKEYQKMREAAFAVIREIGITTGGCNVQFAINPKNGAMRVIEVNPRVSRSSALASKATGYPIAKIAAKLALGYCLNELLNEITANQIPCSFEPSLDYVVVKVPRFNFEKFQENNPILAMQMRSTGEAMAIGRTFQEALQKALRAVEMGYSGLNSRLTTTASNSILQCLGEPKADLIFVIADAFRLGYSIAEIYAHCAVDPWFLSQIQEIINSENQVSANGLDYLTKDNLRQLKQQGFSDKRLSELLQLTAQHIRVLRLQADILPTYKRIDSCAGEFSTETSYLYSTYEDECEAFPTNRNKIIILGSGPNRIGQGIEFDYCCVHAANAFKKAHYETIMINSNPETVSTDYNSCDRLYFEAITLEDVLNIVEIEKPQAVLGQFGGQTSLLLAVELERLGITLLGFNADTIDLCENRERFKTLLASLDLKQPPGYTFNNDNEALASIEKIKFPIVLRPSDVIAGNAMRIIANISEFHDYLKLPSHNNKPVLIEEFLADATEVEIDAICDGSNTIIFGMMEQLELAGIHSGDSTCIIPPISLSRDIICRLQEYTKKIVAKLTLVGLVNIQFAVQGQEIYTIEVNPRASRTIPFVSKTLGLSLVSIAVECMLGKSLITQGFADFNHLDRKFFTVKMPIFSFFKFKNSVHQLGIEMKSTGEVMGIGKSWQEAYVKCLKAAKQMHFPNTFITMPSEHLHPQSIYNLHEIISREQIT